MELSDRYKRPPAYDDDVYKWYLGKVPRTIHLDATGETVVNPAFTNAIFVVHGMGKQQWAHTAAVLRSGFENALESLYENGNVRQLKPEDASAPFIYEGFWADYDDIRSSFPDDWKQLQGTKGEFFSLLWKKRTSSVFGTFLWLLGQQLRLLKPKTLWAVGLFPAILYILLQAGSLTILALLTMIFPKVVAQVLGDVRLYAAPRGVIERAIVQRIDKRVGERFLQLIGLDWDFKPLPASKKIQSNGKPVEFERIIWVAHSLGSVVSYNVLSDLFARAGEFEKSGTPVQRKGAQKLRERLRRFVTIGSPLDKFAFLWGREALRPWPAGSRQLLLRGGEDVTSCDRKKVKDWWINFHCLMDPVSGALSDPLICGNEPPINVHVGFREQLKLIGLAHVQYWSDRRTTEFILSRMFGKEFIPLTAYNPDCGMRILMLKTIGFFTWLVVNLVVLIPIYKFLFRPLALLLWNRGGDILQAIVTFFNPFVV